MDKTKDFLDRNMALPRPTQLWLGPKRDISGQHRALSEQHGYFLSQTGHSRACSLLISVSHKIKPTDCHLEPKEVHGDDRKFKGQLSSSFYAAWRFLFTIRFKMIFLTFLTFGTYLSTEFGTYLPSQHSAWAGLGQTWITIMT